MYYTVITGVLPRTPGQRVIMLIPSTRSAIVSRPWLERRRVPRRGPAPGSGLTFDAKNATEDNATFLAKFKYSAG